MKILCFNWRDVTHPMAGGAEVYLHQIARRLAREHEVTLFCGKYQGCKGRERIDGIEIMRRGGSFTLYIHALFSYLFTLRKENYDLIIDSINGVPFFTPLYVGKPKVAIIHHLVKRKIFFKELPFPLSFVGWFAERLIPLIYRRTTMVTVSSSSRQELIDFGISDKKLHTVYNAIDQDNMSQGEKSERPLIVYVGRIKGYKQIDHLIKAFQIVGREIPEADLIIAGRGDYDELKDLTAKLENCSHVSLVGEITEQEKVDILKRAWVFVIPSMKEGWGISVIEANACGTMAIAYNVPGLRDAIKDSETGLLVSRDNIGELAQTIIRLLKDRDLRTTLSLNALEWSRNFSWDNSTSEFSGVIEKVINADKAMERLLP